MSLLFVSIFVVVLLNTKMRENAKGRIFIAWLLLMTLMPFFMVKTFHHHEEDAHQQNAYVLQDRRDIVSAFVCQLRRGRINLYYADDTKEKENHPYHLVAFEYVL